MLGFTSPADPEVVTLLGIIASNDAENGSFLRIRRDS
jgi:hypothetical protein